MPCRRRVPHRRFHPYVAHDHHRGVMVHVEECEPMDGVAEYDQEGVHELYDLGEDATKKPRRIQIHQSSKRSEFLRKN